MQIVETKVRVLEDGIQNELVEIFLKDPLSLGLAQNPHVHGPEQLPDRVLTHQGRAGHKLVLVLHLILRALGVLLREYPVFLSVDAVDDLGVGVRDTEHSGPLVTAEPVLCDQNQDLKPLDV